ncbi:16 kDa heat shock protein A (plasmid) [Buchnera aphidicola (Nipponaphis monzeni)]|uniref:16 kDa heat shock protein A n=1 Tax=Buchnera aphidicola (Nipponaphis monzeni) TaxID=2495405 RepID=A0A455TAS6_9GAMM|nr:Hsp20 family protein [Buchnera aphidicola]BBI01457.1 16 kDa heat shock protein A [Buchnera aphidicola (Nipponaphis monzeni)]
MSIESFTLLPSFTDDIFANRFNQIDKVFSTLTGSKPLSDVPPYDIVQLTNTHHQLVVSVPGFDENELEILVQNNQLKINGKKFSNPQILKNNKFIHQGIRCRNFSLNFNLSRHIKVKNACLVTGLLKIDFEQQSPETDKTEKIFINTLQKNKSTIAK